MDTPTKYREYTISTILARPLLTFMCRENVLKWNGWGYKDSGFRFNEKNVAEFIGKR